MTADDARIPYVRRCVVQRDGRPIDAVICSLGLHDVYVTFPSPANDAIPAAGERVCLRFHLPGDPEPIVANATVTWRNLDNRVSVDGMPRGCRLALDPLRPDDERRIRELTEDFRQSPSPRIAVPSPRSGFIRIPYVEPCLLVGEHATWDGVICNLSLLGAYVTLAPCPPMGAKVHLFFKTPDKPTPSEVPCEVAWTNEDERAQAHALPPGCGLRFLDDEIRGEIELLILEYESLPRR